MKVTLKNIGLVESAEINIGGLTVIAGHNSVGKSYIGKAIYSGVKAEKQNFKDDYEEKEVLKSKCSSLVISLISETNNDSFFSFFSIWLGKTNSAEISLHQLHVELLDFIYELKINYPTLATKTNIKEVIDDIEQANYQPLNKTQLSILEHNFLIKSIFKGAYNSILTPNEVAKFNFSIHDEQLLEIEVENNQTTAFSSKEFIPYTNITLIETPTILSLVSYIRDNLAFSEKQSRLLPAYILDLVQKLVEGSYDSPTNNPLYNSIIKTIQGQLTIDGNQVLYKDQSNNSYNINNVASGIKSFGIIQLLLAGEHIRPDSILVIDEPEVHLHPEWQLEYAKLLVELVKHNIPIIVTSHSPYFVEALKVYADKENIGDKTYFYLGEMGEKGSTFKDVTQNLDLLFDKFAAPMLKLIVDK